MLRAALQYFMVVFGAGFLLGTIRVLLLAPRLGVRTAELLEMPVMVAISFAAARWVARRFHVLGLSASLGMGLLALLLLIGAELLLVWISGATLENFIASRDPISGSAYLVALILFGLMPWLVRKRSA
jgi:hypothetical protein